MAIFTCRARAGSDPVPAPPPPTPDPKGRTGYREKGLPGHSENAHKRNSCIGGHARKASRDLVYCCHMLGIRIPNKLIKISIMPDSQFAADTNDESLQRYKESLGLSGGNAVSDPNDPRVCIIQSLTMEAPGREPITTDLQTPGSEKTLKDHPFKIKEGAKFTMVATFKVQHEILSGLHYVQVVKRKGIKVSKDSEMIVSWHPIFEISGGMELTISKNRAAMLPAPTRLLFTRRSVSFISYLMLQNSELTAHSPRGGGSIRHAGSRSLQRRVELC